MKTIIRYISLVCLFMANACVDLTEKMITLGTAGCPPYHLAFVIGGTSADQPLTWPSSLESMWVRTSSTSRRRRSTGTSTVRPDPFDEHHQQWHNGDDQRGAVPGDEAAVAVGDARGRLCTGPPRPATARSRWYPTCGGVEETPRPATRPSSHEADTHAATRKNRCPPARRRGRARRCARS